MWIPIALILGLLLATAVIAHVSDTLGKRLGKKRVSVFGLRPRHSATVLTVASSWGIMGFTMLVLLGVYAPLKNAIFHYESVRARLTEDNRIAEEKLKLAARELKTKNSQIETVNFKLEATTDKLQDARRNEQKARRDFQTAQQQQRAAVAKFQSAQKALLVSQGQLKSTKSELAEGQAQVAQAQSQVAKAQSRLIKASAELASRQSQVKAAQAQLKIATAARIQADAAALRSQQAAKRAYQAELIARRLAMVAGQQNLKLQKQNAGLETKNEGLESKNEALESKTKALQAAKKQLDADIERTIALAADRTNEVNNLYQVAIGDIRLPVDQTLAERRLDAEQNPEQIEKELRYLVETAQAATTKNYLPGAVVVANSTIADPDKEGRIELDESQTIQFYADRLAQVNKPVSARLVSAFNYPIGEKWVRARFVLVPIRTVYASRENITEGVIAGDKSEAAVFGQLNKLVDSARFNAVKRGASPPLSPEAQNFFDGDTGQKLFDALRQVQKVGHPVSVRIVAARDLDSAEPLQVRFVVGDQT